MDKYFFEVFESCPRQGPGSTETTRKAFSYLDYLPSHPKILDVGCGSGSQTIDLAHLSTGTITAVDLNSNLLSLLNEQVQKFNLQKRVNTLNGDMNKLPFEEEQFDLIWAEGSIYNIGIENGINNWKKYLKSGGYLVFTDACYFKQEIPQELKDFWKTEYPDMRSVNENISIAKKCGMKLINHFPLPHYAWKLEFYDHIEAKTKELQQKYPDNQEAQECFSMILDEIKIFDKYNTYFGYEFFVLRK